MCAKFINDVWSFWNSICLWNPLFPIGLWIWRWPLMIVKPL